MNFEIFLKYISGFSWKGKNAIHSSLGFFWALALFAYSIGFSIYFWIGETNREKSYWVESKSSYPSSEISRQFVVAVGIEDEENKINFNNESYLSTVAYKQVQNKLESAFTRKNISEALNLIDCNSINISDDSMIEVNSLQGFKCIDLSTNISNEDLITNKINIILQQCSSSTTCKDSTEIDYLLEKGRLTIYSPRFLIKQEDRSFAFSLGGKSKDSWLNVSESSDSFENKEDQNLCNIELEMNWLEYDTIVTQSKQNSEFISLLGAQLFFLWMILDLIVNYILFKQMNKEVTLRLLPSKELESELLQPLIDKAKKRIEQKKTEAAKINIDIEIQTDGQKKKGEDAKNDLQIMNTDNFYQFYVNGQQQENMSYTNDIQFVPDYSQFEIQKLIQTNRQQLLSQQANNRSKRQSFVNNNNLSSSNLFNNINNSPINFQANGNHQYQNIPSKNGSLVYINSNKNNSFVSLNNGVSQQPRDSVYQNMSTLNKIQSISHLQDSLNALPLPLVKCASSNDVDIQERFTSRQNSFQNYNNIISPSDSYRDSSRPALEKDKFNFFQPSLQQLPRRQSNVVRNSNGLIVERQVSDQGASRASGSHSPGTNTTPILTPPIRNRVHSLFAAERKMSIRVIPPPNFFFQQQIPKRNSVVGPVITQPPQLQLNNAPIQEKKTVKSGTNLKEEGEEQKIRQQKKQSSIKEEKNNKNQELIILIPENKEINSKQKINSKHELEKVIEEKEKEPEQDQSSNKGLNNKRKISLSQLDFGYFNFNSKESTIPSMSKFFSSNFGGIDSPLLAELNPARILDLLFEFDRLKSIILDSSQLQLFEYITQSPLNKHEYFSELTKKNSQSNPFFSSFHGSDRSDNEIHSPKEKIFQGWKAMKIIEEKKEKSEIDSRLIGSINDNIYCLINSSNLDEIFSPSQDHPNLTKPGVLSNGFINQIGEQQSIDFYTRARGKAEAVQQTKSPRENNLSESSCNKIVADENFNF